MGTEETDLETSEEVLIPEVSVERPEQFKSRISIEPILFALFLTEGLSDSVTVNFILMRTCEIHFKFNKSICSQLSGSSGNKTDDIEAEIQPYSAIILTGMNFVSIFFPAIVSLFVGPWSDYNGRKLVIIIPAFGYFLKHAIFVMFSAFPNLGPEYGLLVVLPVALCGGFVNFISSIYAYVSDITEEGNRSFRISLLEAVMYLGSNIGLLSSSYIYKSGGIYGNILIYGLCAFIIVIVIVPTYFFVPESVQITARGNGLWRVFEFKLFKEMLQVCFKKREGYQRAVIFLIIASLTISISTGIGESNIIFLFTKLRFGWDIREFTLWTSTMLVIQFSGLIFGIFVFTKWLKISDAALGILCYGLKAATSFFIAFIPPKVPHLMFYSGLINVFGGLCGPVGRSILSKIVPKEDLGKVFALTSSSESVFPLAFVPLYTMLYNATIKTVPGAFLLVTGSFFFLCFIFAIIIYVISKTNSQRGFEKMENENESG